MIQPTKSIMRIGLQGLIGLLMAIVVTFGYAQDTDNKQQIVDSILRKAGVSELLVQVPSWVDQELKNLQAAPVAVDQKEMAIVRSGLAPGMGSNKFHQSLLEKLASEFSLQQLQSIDALFDKPQIKELQRLQAKTESEYIRSGIRSYKAKLNNSSPRGSRVDIVKSLDNHLFQSQIEADLKVELRKNLLASVSLLKSHRMLEETLLEKELSAYRERVGEKINRDALVTYLYLFKRTPSNQLQQMVSLFANPAFTKFMASCHQALVSNLQTSRQTLSADIRLANSAK